MTELETRRRIHGLVQQHPGLHFRDLVSRLDLAQGTVQYHLGVLVREGLLTVSEDRGFTRYYAGGRVRPEDRPILDALRRQYARCIVAHLVEKDLSTQELSTLLGKAPSTVSWHLARLTEAGVVEKERQGQTVLYRLARPGRVVYLYTVYRASLMDRLVDGLLGVLDAHSGQGSAAPAPPGGGRSPPRDRD